MATSLLSSKAGFAPLVRGHRAVHSVTRRRRPTVRARASGEGEAPTAAAFTDVNEDEEAAVDEEEEYVETPEELRERRGVGELVGWCVSRGAAGSGLSVLLPDGSGRGRGLEASRDLAVRTFSFHLSFRV
jgi:hypothetical protein